MTKEELLSIIAHAEEEKRALTEEEKTIINQALDECRTAVTEEKETTVEEEETRDDNETPTVEESNDENETKEEPETENTVEDESEVKEKENKRSINTCKTQMNSKFSLVKSIRSVVNNTAMDEVNSAVIEAGKNEARNAGLAANGQIVIPSEETRDIYTVTAEGEDIVETNLMSVLEPLRAESVIGKSGMRMMSGLVGNVQIPVMSKQNSGWEGEITDAKDGAGAFTSVTLSPRRICSYIDVSRQFIMQDSVGAENAIRTDLVKAIAEKLEETILSDFSGSTTTPAGIFSYVTPTAVTSFADICDLEAKVDDANVGGNKVYLGSNKAKAYLRNLAKSAKSTQLVMENGEIDGTPMYATSLIDGKKVIYGNFADSCILAQWGGLSLTVDTVSKAINSQVRIVAEAWFDFKVVRPEALAAATLG